VRSSVVSPFRRLRSRTQLLSSIAEQTVRFFLIVLANSRGAISRGLFPCSHPDPQKLAFLPFPKVICVQFAKRRLSVSSQGTCVPAQVLSGDIHWSQSHRSRRARENLWRSRIPRPPSFLGSVVLVQLTLHLPLEMLPSPAQRNRRQILSRSSKVPFVGLITVIR
jgi:hypothetical protein